MNSSNTNPPFSLSVPPANRKTLPVTGGLEKIRKDEKTKGIDSELPAGGPSPEDKPEAKEDVGGKIEELKKELENVKKFDYRLKKIEELLENLETPVTSDSNLNDSLYQSANMLSNIRYARRIIRRVKTGSIKKQDAIKKLKLLANLMQADWAYLVWNPKTKYLYEEDGEKFLDKKFNSLEEAQKHLEDNDIRATIR